MERNYKIIQLRNVERNQAEKEIVSYLKKKKKALTSEIADNLRLDIVLTNEILHKLGKAGKVNGKRFKH